MDVDYLDTHSNEWGMLRKECSNAGDKFMCKWMGANTWQAHKENMETDANGLLGDTGISFLQSWMGEDNLIKWVHLCKLFKHETTKDFVCWMLNFVENCATENVRLDIRENTNTSECVDSLDVSLIKCEYPDDIDNLLRNNMKENMSDSESAPLHLVADQAVCYEGGITNSAIPCDDLPTEIGEPTLKLRHTENVVAQAVLEFDAEAENEEVEKTGNGPWDIVKEETSSVAEAVDEYLPRDEFSATDMQNSEITEMDEPTESEDTNMDKHASRPVKNLSCDAPACQFSASCPNTLSYHKKVHHSAPTADMKYTCELCLYGTPYYSCMKHHKITCHGEGKVKNFSRKTHKRERRKKSCASVEKDSRCLCTVCGKPYTQAYMKRHMLYMHSEEKPTHEKKFLCTMCGYSSAYHGTLNTHIKLVHGAKDLFCDFCTYKTSLKSALKSHVTRCHTALSLVPCAKCGKTFRGRHNMLQHVRAVHVISAKRVICSVCQKAFRDKNSLRKHSRLHTGEKPYACDLCDHRCSQACNLRTHKKLVHKVC